MSELSDIEPIRQSALEVPISEPAPERIMPGARPSAGPGGEPAASAAPGLAESAALPTTPFPEPSASAGAPVTAARSVSPLLRLRRLLAGVALLAVTWSFLLVALVLTHAAWTFVHGTNALLLRVGAGIGTTLVVAWLGVALIACLLAGAYCLMLAVSRRD